MGWGGRRQKKVVMIENRARFLNGDENWNFNFFFDFFGPDFFGPKIWQSRGCPPAPPLVVGQARGGCVPNGKISFLRQFRELRGRTYHFYHQNHGEDGSRARYFGPTGLGCGYMAKFRSKIVNHTHNRPKWPRMGHFGLYFGNFSAVRAQNGPKSWGIIV